MESNEKLVARAVLLKRTILDELAQPVVDKERVMRYRAALDDVQLVLARRRAVIAQGSLRAVQQGRPSLVLGGARW